ncbi:MAG: DUF4097 family beta strand repeat-containing protein [Candidatus Edwardsbacteria bacterium]|nr:DUF4097 family beta strand repeat-containing protein [Candidatus Edwardsbacteria bacterium]
MSDETLRILKLLEAGKISSKEAEDLLSAVKDGGTGQRNGSRYQYRYGPHPGRIVSEVMREVNPGKIAAQAMASVRESMESLQDFDGLEDLGERFRGRASAEEIQTITVPAQGITAVSLSQPRSDIKVTGADADQIVINANIDVWGDDEDEAQERLKSLKVVTETDNGVLRIKLEGPPWTKKRRAQVDFQLELPKNIGVELGTASGDIEIADINRGAKVQSASGEISLARCGGAIELSTASGDVDLKDLSATAAVRVQTVSGDIEINSAGQFAIRSVSGDISADLPMGKIDLNTVSGDIELDALSFEEIIANTTSGDARIEIKATPEATIQLQSISGDIEVELPDNPLITIEALTTSGDIDCDLELAERNQTSRKLTGRMGNGRTRLTARTTSGDISLS